MNLYFQFLGLKKLDQINNQEIYLKINFLGLISIGNQSTEKKFASPKSIDNFKNNYECADFETYLFVIRQLKSFLQLHQRILSSNLLPK